MYCDTNSRMTSGVLSEIAKGIGLNAGLIRVVVLIGLLVLKELPSTFLELHH